MVNYIFSGTKKLINNQVPKHSMKLLQQEHSEYNGKKYYKNWVIIPQKIIEQLGWKKGDELEPNVKGNKLEINKK